MRSNAQMPSNAPHEGHPQGALDPVTGPAAISPAQGADGADGPVRIPQPGEVLDGKYRIDGTLGQGGMAVVLGAMHLHLDERVAIKVLLPQWAEDPEFVDRFMREGRSAIKIRSEHVVRVLDVGVLAGRPYLVMEYLEGEDLDRVLETKGALPVDVAVDFLLQACEAIAEAHVSGIIHRDLKPANLFLTHRADGSPCVKVLDFGISKSSARASGVDRRTTQPQVIMGSPHYMSPEQMQSARDADERSDIWALGAILHELVAGAPPFKGDSITALCATILKDAPPPLTTFRADCPPGLERVVLRCLEKDPSNRYANIAELAADLADYGTPAARTSAERIARVLDGTTDRRWMPAPSTSVPMLLRPPAPLAGLGSAQVEGAASVKTSHVVATGSSAAPARLVEPPAPLVPLATDAVHIPSLRSQLASPPRARSRLFGYVVAGLALLGVGGGIGWMIVRSDAAIRSSVGDEPAPGVQLTNGAPRGTEPAPLPFPAPSAASAPTVATLPSTSPVVAPPVPVPPSTETPQAAPPPEAKPTRAPEAKPPVPPARNVKGYGRGRSPRIRRGEASPETSPLPIFPTPPTTYVPSVGPKDDDPAPPATEAPSGTAKPDETPPAATGAPPASPAPSNSAELFDERK